ncbi:hypothetical protein Ccar_07420 [Clostridium carboxidivorans P7]|uniref:hypothetical protein n=2 Tax=Clostridium carboxidivorans TaxID=217159 RepID=UPI0001D394D0|nr:hypothetical protein [Clostridium carboxidivorans]AKN30668.1 hypothetical protein Ccar_07420 [Clostridium carboxidivorans P7]EFG86428.1 hypothetical protein CLCAR_4254 [Clostridium carboxidivorans P7]
MARGRTITFKYKHFEYDEHVKKLLSIDLNSKDEMEIKKIYNNYESLNVHRGYEYIIKDLYILMIKRNISTTDIANIYDVGPRTIQIWLKELGLNRTQKEAQKIAVTKRDYKSIKKGSTMPTQLLSCSHENNIRYKLNMFLEQELNKYEIIIGVTALGISDFETDIPVIILKSLSMSKFLIEIEKHSHSNNSRAKGYTILTLSNEEDALKKVVAQILKEVKGI